MERHKLVTLLIPCRHFQHLKDKRSCFSADLNSYICKKPANGGWTTPQPTQPPTGYCPGPEFRQFSGNCYRLVEEPMAWGDAKASCNSLGPRYNLASVHSAKENALLASLLYLDKAHFDTDFGEVFIGGISKEDAGEEFQWADYSEFNMDNWARDQPDNVRSRNETLLQQ